MDTSGWTTFGISEVELSLRREIQTYDVVNKLLHASLEDLTVEGTLSRALDCIVSAPFFKVQSRGAIFLVGDEPGVLILRVERGLSEPLKKLCARVAFGQCLCGRAAQRKEVICANHVDADHDIGFEGMEPHGHYCAPILLGQEVLGVINLYVDDGHVFRLPEINFIKAVSNVIAAVIQRRQAEEKLRETQMQLLQAGKLASIGQLAAGIAHEINNPLGFIGSNIEVFHSYVEAFMKIYACTEALSDSIKSRDFEMGRKIVRNLEQTKKDVRFDHILKDAQVLFKESEEGIARIKTIIDNLREFSFNGNSVAPIQVEKVIDQVANILANQIFDKAELKKEYGPTPVIHVDPHKLGQVIINMLVNATQAIESEGIITVKTYADNDKVCVVIRDNGCGIPPENISKIFDPFFTTRPVGKGVGLGLSVSYDIIKKFKGQILVSSEVGRGTEFIVELPNNGLPLT